MYRIIATKSGRISCRNQATHAKKKDGGHESRDEGHPPRDQPAVPGMAPFWNRRRRPWSGRHPVMFLKTRSSRDRRVGFILSASLVPVPFCEETTTP